MSGVFGCLIPWGPFTLIMATLWSERAAWCLAGMGAGVAFGYVRGLGGPAVVPELARPSGPHRNGRPGRICECGVVSE